MLGFLSLSAYLHSLQMPKRKTIILPNFVSFMYCLPGLHLFLDAKNYLSKMGGGGQQMKILSLWTKLNQNFYT